MRAGRILGSVLRHQEAFISAKSTKARGSGCGSGDTCEGTHRSDRATAAVVGRQITDPAELAQLGIGPGENAVEVTLDLLPEAQ